MQYSIPENHEVGGEYCYGAYSIIANDCCDGLVDLFCLGARFYTDK